MLSVLLNNIWLIGGLFFIFGLAAGIVLFYLYYLKMRALFKKGLHDVEQINLKQRKRTSDDLKDLERALIMKSNELKDVQSLNETTADQSSDLIFEISKINEVNQSLKEENESLTVTIREYVMLLNAKKDEIQKLKRQLNQEI